MKIIQNAFEIDQQWLPGWVIIHKRYTSAFSSHGQFSQLQLQQISSGWASARVGPGPWFCFTFWSLTHGLATQFSEGNLDYAMLNSSGRGFRIFRPTHFGIPLALLDAVRKRILVVKRTFVRLSLALGIGSLFVSWKHFSITDLSCFVLVVTIGTGHDIPWDVWKMDSCTADTAHFIEESWLQDIKKDIEILKQWLKEKEGQVEETPVVHSWESFSFGL